MELLPSAPRQAGLNQPAQPNQSDPLLQALERHFGWTEFRPGQRAVVEALLQGRDCLAVLPTGAGKSLCYQLPALVRQGLMLVVSPLVALMEDQVLHLQRRGIQAACLHGGLDPGSRRQLLGRLRDNRGLRQSCDHGLRSPFPRTPPSPAQTFSRIWRQTVNNNVLRK